MKFQTVVIEADQWLLGGRRNKPRFIRELCGVKKMQLDIFIKTHQTVDLKRVYLM